MKTTTYTYTTIDLPGGGFAQSINSKGDVVGFYQVGPVEHGFLYSGGNVTTIDSPGSLDTVALGINDKGLIIGRYEDTSGKHGFLDSGGIYTTIDPPGSHGAQPEAINAKGDVIGFYLDGNGVDHGFLY